MKSVRRCLRDSVQVLKVIPLLLFMAVGTASAETITKAFELGTTRATASTSRTFSLPCRTRMVASITYSRAGAAGESNDVPIFVEVREPGTTADGEGTVLAVKEGLVATRTPKTINLTGVTSTSSGCSMPWRVRVKHDAAGAAPVAVSGNITVSFNTPTSRISLGSGRLTLAHQQSTTKNLGDSNGIGQGAIVITGSWNHSILGATGPNALKLQFQLLDPSGTRVAFTEGYPTNEFRDLPKLKLNHRIEDCVIGQWKLKIVNIDPRDDAKDIDVVVNFTPDCP